jgi:hypothetical protein
MTQIKKPDNLVVENAIIDSTTKKKLKKISEIYTDDYGVRYQFRRIKPLAFQRGLAYVRRRIEVNKPKPPLQRISGKKQHNKNHPDYLFALKVWEKEIAEFSPDKFKDDEENLDENNFFENPSFKIMLLIGVKLLDSIPPKELWLDDVLDHIYFGLCDEETRKETLTSSYKTEQQVLEMLYKQYVVCNEETLPKISNFFNEMNQSQMGVEEAVNTFPITEE